VATLGPDGNLARQLATAGFGVFDETGATGTVFAGEEPPDPDNVVTVLLSAGGRIPSAVSEEWLLTVRVRDEDPEAVNRRLRDITVYIQERGQGVFGSLRFARIDAAGTPIPLSRDERRRFRVEQLFVVLTKKSFLFA
jgi:hypothetical protein